MYVSLLNRKLMTDAIIYKGDCLFLFNLFAAAT